MPIFEFRCNQCGKKFASLVGMTADSGELECPHCSGTSAEKLVSRVARYRTEDQRVDEMADRLENMGEPESPTEAREMVREMGRAMDDDMADEMEEMYELDVDDLGE
jgi:putative FmdB family regulatory protein